MPDTPRRAIRLFTRSSWPEASRLAEILREETIGGLLLLIATACALFWANSPWSDSYHAVRDATVGSHALHLDLTVAQWAADGLLAIFFFVAGLELKREFVAGDLRDPGRAAVPVAAAVGGVLAPAVLYALIVGGAGGDALRGWAIPTATDIAFALAALAVIGTHLPAALRTFLLTLAVVDDLLAILIIAVFYTRNLSVTALLLTVVPLALFALLVHRRVRSAWLLLPLAAATWTLLHASGVHATVAGVLLAFTVPVGAERSRTEQRRPAEDRDEGPDRAARDPGTGLAEHFEHRWRPVSAGVAVPLFALMSAGVTIGGAAGLARAFLDRVTLGIVVGLVVGKTVGVFSATFLVSRFTGASLDPAVAWIDVFGLSVLSGIGFTVSLFIGELAFGYDTVRDDHVKIAVLAGSLTAAVLAAVVLRLRNRIYRRRYEAGRATPGR